MLRYDADAPLDARRTNPETRLDFAEPRKRNGVSIVDTNEADTDGSLIAAYLGGDHAAFDAIVDRHSGEVYAFLCRFVGDRTLAEDLLQETFLQVHLSADSFDTGQRLRPWLFTIAANKARDRMRRKGRRPAISLDAAIANEQSDPASFVDLIVTNAPSAGELVAHDELKSAVRETVANLPENFREILLLSYFHGFSYKEIAEMLEIPVGTVKSRLHGAVARFAEHWKKARGDE
jgi:RNA polymerase sigma-70 factor (ECF subfamily)